MGTIAPPFILTVQEQLPAEERPRIFFYMQQDNGGQWTSTIQPKGSCAFRNNEIDHEKVRSVLAFIKSAGYSECGPTKGADANSFSQTFCDRALADEAEHEITNFLNSRKLGFAAT